LHGEATWAAGVRPAPNFTLRDQSGGAFTLASLRGHTVALAFLDSHCTQECPLAGAALAHAEAALPAAQRPVFVAVSVNPADTPASVRAATAAWGLARLGAWHWVMARAAQLAPVWRAYGIYVHPTPTDIVHTQALYLIDRRGFERSGYLWPYLPNFVALDLRTLAGERS
jgi:cytochrome oxidase Cu insertion factor (SCO1/SenC/PrrC family)